MAGNRIRTIQLERPTAGKTADETRGYDAMERSLRNAIPQWARGSVLLGGATGIEFTAGTVIYIQHKLGRRHAGWVLAQPLAQGAELSQLPETDSDFSEARRDTHLQLRPFRRIDHTENVNFPSIAAGASSEVTFTVTGARAGDAVVASPTGVLNSGLAYVHSRISATDQVAVQIANFSAGSINPSAQDWHFAVFERNGGATFRAWLIAW